MVDSTDQPGPVKKLKSAPKRLYVEGVHNNIIIHKNIDGMCVPFGRKVSTETLPEIKYHHFFPYIDSTNDLFGYLILEDLVKKEYRAPTCAHFKVIFQKITELPEVNIPENNRRKVLNQENGQLVEICYWPDSYYKSVQNNKMNKSKGKKSDTNESGRKRNCAQEKKKNLEEALSHRNSDKIVNMTQTDDSFFGGNGSSFSFLKAFENSPVDLSLDHNYNTSTHFKLVYEDRLKPPTPLDLEEEKDEPLVVRKKEKIESDSTLNKPSQKEPPPVEKTTLQKEPPPVEKKKKKTKHKKPEGSDKTKKRKRDSNGSKKHSKKTRVDNTKGQTKLDSFLKQPDQNVDDLLDQLI